MTEAEILQRIRAELPAAKVEVGGGGCDFRVRVEDEAFGEMRPVERQRRIYRLFHDEITSGALHSLSVEAVAPGRGRA